MARRRWWRGALAFLSWRGAALTFLSCLLLVWRESGRDNKGYVEPLARIRAGILTPPQDIIRPSPDHVTIGLIIVNLNQTAELPEKLRGKIETTLEGLFTYTRGPVQLVIITDRASAGPAGRVLDTVIGRDLADRVIRPRSWHWRVRKGLTSIQCRLVDLAEIMKASPAFVAALRGRKTNFQAGDKYMSDLFYIAPIYHRAFLNLDRMMVLDSTDLGIVSDLRELWDQQAEQQEDAVMSVGLDLAPHYFVNLQDYRKKNPGTNIGLPGRSQGLNTGVVLFDLEKMRSSRLYSSYLHPEAVADLMDRFHLNMTVGDQDWFTALSFAQPSLFTVLPCRFNTQTSLQYWSSNKPVFAAYHQCEAGHPGNIKIFHRNGCGPKPENCGAAMVDIDEYKQFLYVFNFISACRFWQVLYCAFSCPWAETFEYRDLTCSDLTL